MALSTFYISSQIVNVDVTGTTKVIMMPSVSSFMNQSILIRDSTGACSATNRIYISTQGIDRIENTLSTCSLTRSYETIRFTTFGVSSWSILQNSPPISFLLPTTKWTILIKPIGTASFSYNSPTQTLTLSTFSFNNSSPLGTGAASFAYISSLATSGSFTYSYSVISQDFGSCAFERVTTTPPDLGEGFINFFIPPLFRINTSNIESGTRTITWTGQPTGVYITIGTYATGFAGVSCGFTGLPLSL